MISIFEGGTSESDQSIEIASPGVLPQKGNEAKERTLKVEIPAH